MTYNIHMNKVALYKSASLTVSELAELTSKDFANISRITHKLEANTYKYR